MAVTLLPITVSLLLVVATSTGSLGTSLEYSPLKSIFTSLDSKPWKGDSLGSERDDSSDGGGDYSQYFFIDYYGSQRKKVYWKLLKRKQVPNLTTEVPELEEQEQAGTTPIFQDPNNPDYPL